MTVGYPMVAYNSYTNVYFRGTAGMLPFHISLHGHPVSLASKTAALKMILMIILISIISENQCIGCGLIHYQDSHYGRLN